jgi:hypothetical protein
MVVVIGYEAKATARRALTFIVRIFVNDTIAITVWASFYFHVATRAGGSGLGPGPAGCPREPRPDPRGATVRIIPTNMNIGVPHAWWSFLGDFWEVGLAGLAHWLLLWFIVHTLKLSGDLRVNGRTLWPIYGGPYAEWAQGEGDEAPSEPEQSDA